MTDSLRKILIVISAISIIASFCIYIFFKTTYGNIFSGVFLSLGILLILYTYLQGGFGVHKVIITENTQDGEGNSINVNVVESYEGLSEETIKLILENEQGKYIELIDYIEKYRNRLKKHIDTLSRNSNLNLIIGLSITIFGIGILAYFVFKEYKPINKDELLFFYISRFSIVILTEIFALFFLRLYKTNLSEIKYFHNEITNIDSKIVSLKTSLLVDDSESLKQTLNELSKTERNFILKKGESTTELERMKYEKKENIMLIENLTELVKKLTNKDK